MDYYDETQRLLKLLDKKNMNVVRHFFSQLQQYRRLLPYAVINAISASTYVEDEFQLIENSVTVEPYMKKISIQDIRNVIVFLIRKEFNKVVAIQPYIDEEETDETFLVLDTPSTIGVHIRKLEKLIETVYYITHIFFIVRTPNVVERSTWLFCHDYFHTTTLEKSVKHIYTLLNRLIRSS